MMPKLDTRRRNILKLFVLGGAAFVLGKVFGPSLSFFGGATSVGKETFFKNFRVVENAEELGFYDKLGNEILILEKD